MAQVVAVIVSNYLTITMILSSVICNGKDSAVMQERLRC